MSGSPCWTQILESRAAVAGYLLAHRDLDAYTVTSSRDYWLSLTPAELQAERVAAWRCNDAERYMIARSLLAAPPLRLAA